jgi:integrase
MARGKVGKLKASELKTKEAGLKSDGGNLYLRTFVSPSGHISRGWIFRFQLPGRNARDMGLGSLDSINLAMARKLAAENRELVAIGVDPIERRNEIVSARRVAEAVTPPPTFDLCARDYIAAHRSGWRNLKHAQQWTNTLKTYASPVVGKLRVNEINADHILKILKPIWHGKTVTASRVRARVETVLDFAIAMKKRPAGDNPARWDGNLKHLLASPEKIAPVNHHAALDYKRVGEFMAQLRQREGIGALALEFTILTCSRTNEALGVAWDEIDMDQALWTVPANRMKAGKEHQVALSGAAMKVLQKVRAMTEKIGGVVGASNLVFSNDRTGGQLSENSLTSILKRMKFDGITVHGFRSCFRDFAGEESHFPNDIIEMALAHTVGTKVEQAYRRKTGFQKRRLLAEAWAGYCAKPAVADAKVLAFKP